MLHEMKTFSLYREKNKKEIAFKVLFQVACHKGVDDVIRKSNDQKEITTDLRESNRYQMERDYIRQENVIFIAGYDLRLS